MNKIRIAGAAAGVVLVSGVVLQVSSAAFTGETSNTGNAWEAGTVTFAANDPASALFASTAQAPGDSETKCILVTYNGSVTPAEAIDLIAADVVSTPGGPDDTLDDGLADDLDLIVDVGPKGTTCTTMAVDGLDALGTANVYTGTLAGFDDAAKSTSWTPNPEGAADDMSRPFRFRVTLGSDTPNHAQGDTAGATFTWSATS